MPPGLLAVLGGSALQISLGVFLYAGDLDDPRARLGLAGIVLASGSALLALMLRRVRGPAVGLNGLSVLILTPQLFIGLLEGFATPTDSPHGGWLYPALLAWICSAIANIAGLSHLQHQHLVKNARPIVPS